MKLYSVNYLGPNSNYEWSVVTIHKSLEGAESAMSNYKNNFGKINQDVDFCIHTIDTDINSDIIFDYEDIAYEIDNDDINDD